MQANRGKWRVRYWIKMLWGLSAFIFFVFSSYEFQLSLFVHTINLISLYLLMILVDSTQLSLLRARRFHSNLETIFFFLGY